MDYDIAGHGIVTFPDDWTDADVQKWTEQNKPPPPPPPETSTLGHAGELLKGIPGGLAQTGIMGIEGAAEGIEEGAWWLKSAVEGVGRPLDKQGRPAEVGPAGEVAKFIREDVRDPVSEFFGPKPGYEESPAGLFGQGLGSAVGYIGAYAISPWAAGLAAVGGGFTQEADMVRSAQERKEFTPTDLARSIEDTVGLDPQGQAILAAGVVGASEIIPAAVGVTIATKGIKALGIDKLLPLNWALKLFRKMPKNAPSEAKEKVYNILRAAGTEMTTEAIQEMAAGVGYNLIAQGLYEPDVDIWDSAITDLAIGGSVGGTLGAALEFMYGRRRGARPLPTDDDTLLLDQPQLALPAPHHFLSPGSGLTISPAEGEDPESFARRQVMSASAEFPLGPYTTAIVPSEGIQVISSSGRPVGPASATIEEAEARISIYEAEQPRIEAARRGRDQRLMAEQAILDEGEKPTSDLREATRRGVSPFGQFRAADVGTDTFAAVQASRAQRGLPSTDHVTVEDLRQAGIAKEKISEVIASRITLDKEVTAEDVAELAREHGIDEATEGFKQLAERAVGERSLEDMTPGQLQGIYQTVEGMPYLKEGTRLPPLRRGDTDLALEFSERQYSEAVRASRQTGAPTSEAVRASLEAAVGEGMEPSPNLVRAILDAMVRRGDAVKRGSQYVLSDRGKRVPSQAQLPQGAATDYVVEQATEGRGGFTVTRDGIPEATVYETEQEAMKARVREQKKPDKWEVTQGDEVVGTFDSAAAAHRKRRELDDEAPGPRARVRRRPKPRLGIRRSGATFGGQQVGPYQVVQRALDEQRNAIASAVVASFPTYDAAYIDMRGRMGKPIEEPLRPGRVEDATQERDVVIPRGGQAGIPIRRGDYTTPEGLKERIASLGELTADPEVRAKFMRAMERAKQRLNRMIPSAEFRLTPTLGGTVEGTFDFAKIDGQVKRLIVLAADRITGPRLGFPGIESATEEEIANEIAGILDHETIHALRSMGVFTDAEWKNLIRPAHRLIDPRYPQGGTSPDLITPSNPTGLIPAGGITIAQSVEARYRTFPRAKIEEEMAADVFRFWAANRRSVVGKPASLLRRIVRFFKGLATSLKEENLFPADRIFEDILEGRAGQRLEVEEAIPAHHKAAREAAYRRGVEAERGPISEPDAPDGLSSRAGDTTLYSVEPQISDEFGRIKEVGLFSSLERAILGLKQKKGTGQQFLKALSSGVSKAERDWTGITGWLEERKDQRVTQEELINYVMENSFKLNMKVLTGSDAKHLTHTIDKGKSDEGIYRTFLIQLAERRETKTSRLDDPIVLRDLKESLNVLLTRVQDQRWYVQRGLEPSNSQPAEIRRQVLDLFGTLEESALYNMRANLDSYIEDLTRRIHRIEASEMAAQRGQQPYIVDAHYPDADLVTFIRASDRSTHVDTSTRSRLLMEMTGARRRPFPERVHFLEEFQSDIHQKGKAEGYQGIKKDPIAEKLSLTDAFGELAASGSYNYKYDVEEDARAIEGTMDVRPTSDQVGLPLIPPQPEVYISRDDEGNIIAVARTPEEAMLTAKRRSDIKNLPPDAPFKGNDWIQLVFRSMTAKAIREGKSWVAWTYGEEHVRRWGKKWYRGFYGGFFIRDKDGYNEEFTDLIVKQPGDRDKTLSSLESLTNYMAHHGLIEGVDGVEVIKVPRYFGTKEEAEAVRAASANRANLTVATGGVAISEANKFLKQVKGGRVQELDLAVLDPNKEIETGEIKYARPYAIEAGTNSEFKQFAAWARANDRDTSNLIEETMRIARIRAVEIMNQARPSVTVESMGGMHRVLENYWHHDFEDSITATHDHNRRNQFYHSIDEYVEYMRTAKPVIKPFKVLGFKITDKMRAHYQRAGGGLAFPSRIPQITGGPSHPMIPPLTIEDKVTDDGAFYSRLVDAVGSIQAKKPISPRQMKEMVASKASENEMEWTGLTDFLDMKERMGEKVTRGEVAEFVKRNKLSIKTVKPTKTIQRVQGRMIDPDRDFSEHVSPGPVDRYEELAITVEDPVLEKEFQGVSAMVQEWSRLHDEIEAIKSAPFAQEQGLDEISTRERQEASKRDQIAELDRLIRSRIKELEGRGYFYGYQASQSGYEQEGPFLPHYFEPNILFHVRNTYRQVDAVGNVMVNEELQSDWHAYLRERVSSWLRPDGSLKTSEEHAQGKKDYGRALPRLADAKAEKFGDLTEDEKSQAVEDIGATPDDDEYIYYGRDTNGEKLSFGMGKEAALEGSQTVIDERRGIVPPPALRKLQYGMGYLRESYPDAPMRNMLWLTMGVKKNIKHAANQGMNGIAWPTGKNAAARFNLGGREIDSIQVYQVSPATMSEGLKITFRLSGPGDPADRWGRGGRGTVKTVTFDELVSSLGVKSSEVPALYEYVSQAVAEGREFPHPQESVFKAKEAPWEAPTDDTLPTKWARAIYDEKLPSLYKQVMKKWKVAPTKKQVGEEEMWFVPLTDEMISEITDHPWAMLSIAPTVHVDQLATARDDFDFIKPRGDFAVVPHMQILKSSAGIDREYSRNVLAVVEGMNGEKRPLVITLGKENTEGFNHVAPHLNDLSEWADLQGDPKDIIFAGMKKVFSHWAQHGLNPTEQPANGDRLYYKIRTDEYDNRRLELTLFSDSNKRRSDGTRGAVTLITRNATAMMSMYDGGRREAVDVLNIITAYGDTRTIEGTMVEPLTMRVAEDEEVEDAVAQEPATLGGLTHARLRAHGVKDKDLRRKIMDLKNIDDFLKLGEEEKIDGETILKIWGEIEGESFSIQPTIEYGDRFIEEFSGKGVKIKTRHYLTRGPIKWADKTLEGLGVPTKKKRDQIRKILSPIYHMDPELRTEIVYKNIDEIRDGLPHPDLTVDAILSVIEGKVYIHHAIQAVTKGRRNDVSFIRGGDLVPTSSYMPQWRRPKFPRPMTPEQFEVSRIPQLQSNWREVYAGWQGGIEDFVSTANNLMNEFVLIRPLDNPRAWVKLTKKTVDDYVRRGGIEPPQEGKYGVDHLEQALMVRELLNRGRSPSKAAETVKELRGEGEYPLRNISEFPLLYSITPSIDAAPLGRRVPPLESYSFRERELVASETRAHQLLYGIMGKVGYDDPRASFERFRTIFQDRMLPVDRWLGDMVKRGATIADSLDAYLRETLYHGRTMERIKAAESELYIPLLQKLKAAKIALAEFEELLYARHARERNLYLLNEFGVENGSGMSDAEADAIETAARQQGKYDEFLRLAPLADAIIRDLNIVRSDAGLIPHEFHPDFSGEMRDFLKRASLPNYKFYVPLRGFAEEEIDPDDLPAELFRRGKGFSISGREDEKAFGRKKRAGDILGHMFLQHQTAIIRAEKNRVAQAMLDFVRENIGIVQDEATIDDPQEPTFQADRTNGTMKLFYPRKGTKGVHTINVKEDGRSIRVFIKDPRVVRAMRQDYGTGSDVSAKFLNVMATTNRYLATINTSWNIDFLIPNLVRDIQTGLGVATQYENVEGLRRDILKNVKPSLAGIRHVLRETGTTTEMSKAFEEFKAAGAATEFLGIRGLEQQLDVIRRELREENPGKQAQLWTKGRKGFIHLQKFVDDYNRVFENAVRLSAYKALRDRGISKEQAGYVAKNLTVNFNKKGEWGQFFNAMYLFYNASLQGSMIVLNAARHSKRMRRTLGVVVAFGMLQDQLNSLLSDDDEDGEKKYDKIPEYALEHNWIFMDPLGLTDNGYIALPMPYGEGHLRSRQGHLIDGVDRCRCLQSPGRDGEFPELCLADDPRSVCRSQQERGLRWPPDHPARQSVCSCAQATASALLVDHIPDGGGGRRPDEQGHGR
jgi:hypothetical protein